MGKKNQGSSIGRSLIKDRFGSNKGKKMVANNSMLHTTEIQDGYDWGRLNLQSVTEESSFQEFLSTAELAGTDFQAEKLNIKFVNPRSNVGLPSADEFKNAQDMHKKYKRALKIPRRPIWTSETTPEELDRNEKEHFLEWRRSLAKLQEEQGVLLTPYEKNLEFWRQLWRVVERSDVVIQIVDARNPLLFRCEDLEKYVKEVSEDKINLILVNKADFLTEQQRQCWAEYFSSVGIRVAFFSAQLASECSIKEEEEEITDPEMFNKESDSEENGTECNSVDIELVKREIVNLSSVVEGNAQLLNKIFDKLIDITGKTSSLQVKGSDTIANSNVLLSKEELIELLRVIHDRPKITEGVTTIGLVGYPNVGKSSTINALMSCKKVSVSATPGKTKHFQTLYLDKDLLLCDCPGLVMPSFVFSKAEMILNGILPIDHMRDHVPPTNLVTSLIPRHVIEDKYGIMLPKPLEGEDQERAPIAEELLNAYAYNRGFMTANGQPDNARAARFILKDFMNGKLLYCNAPQGVDQQTYHTWPERQKVILEDKVLPPRAVRAVKPYHTEAKDIDKEFLKATSNGLYAKGVDGKTGNYKSGQSSQLSTSSEVEKPWKQYNRHKNKGKKEKLRRVYSHLDQH